MGPELKAAIDAADALLLAERDEFMRSDKYVAPAAKPQVRREEEAPFTTVTRRKGKGRQHGAVEGVAVYRVSGSASSLAEDDTVPSRTLYAVAVDAVRACFT